MVSNMKFVERLEWVFWRTNWAKRDYWAMLYYKPRSNVGLKFSLMPIHQCSTIYASIISRLLSWIKNTWDCVMNNAELQEANGEAWVRKVWECSTKSAYHLLTNEVADSPSVWVKLWKVRAPQRCKVHLWLVCMIGCLQIMQRWSVVCGLLDIESTLLQMMNTQNHSSRKKIEETLIDSISMNGNKTFWYICIFAR